MDSLLHQKYLLIIGIFFNEQCNQIIDPNYDCMNEIQRQLEIWESNQKQM